METVTLTVPIAASSLRVSRLILDWDVAVIEVLLYAQNGRRFEYLYTGATATAFMVALNKANLSTKSLHRRIIERLMLDYLDLAGAITGAVD